MGFIPEQLPHNIRYWWQLLDCYQACSVQFSHYGLVLLLAWKCWGRHVNTHTVTALGLTIKNKNTGWPFCHMRRMSAANSYRHDNSLIYCCSGIVSCRACHLLLDCPEFSRKYPMWDLSAPSAILQAIQAASQLICAPKIRSFHLKTMSPRRNGAFWFTTEVHSQLAIKGQYTPPAYSGVSTNMPFTYHVVIQIYHTLIM